jgi:uncharacterized OsmC-like protein
MSTPGQEHPPSDSLWVERVGPKTYVGRNERGAEVRIGQHDHEGVFSPGELLKIALAACSTMSAERPVLRRLGAEDAPIFGGVRSVKAHGHNRYSGLLTELVLPLAGLTAEAREEVAQAALRAVAKGCTVGRTLEHGAHVTVSISDEA